MKEPTTILVDSLAIAHRAKHTTGKMLRNGVIFGFFNQLSTYLSKIPHNNLVFLWDSQISLRKKYYVDYKATRQCAELSELDRRCYLQFNLLRDTIIPKLFNNNFVRKGYEGDDLIASAVLNNKGRFIIISSDGDLFQLLNENVAIKSPTVKSLVTVESFTSLYGISPEQWPLAKAIAGDDSDNIKGVPGVAIKTAIKYILGKTTDATTKKIQAAMKTEEFRRNHWLVKLPLNGTPKITIRPYKPPTIQDMMKFIDQYQLKSFNLEKWIHLLQLT
jgi:DNA polymerase-1